MTDERVVLATLRAMPPRDAQALILRLIDRAPRARCAEVYGITLEAFDVKLWRALRAYLAAGAAAAEPFDQERALAAELEGALDSGAAPLHQDVARALSAARSLETAADELRAALDAAARAEEASPARRREDLLRRAIIVAIILLTAYFYFRSKS